MPNNIEIQIPVPEFIDNIHTHQVDLFRRFDEGKKRFFMLCWHRRARKTTLSLNVLIRECIKNPKKVYGYIAPTYTQAKAIIWRDPNMLFRYLPQEAIKRRNESELFIEFHNGSILVIKGADNPDSIRGQDYEGVVLDEWALMKQMVWEEILRPIITPNPKRWAIFEFTPKGRNFVYDYWNKCEQWPDWYKSYLSVSDSGLVSEEELEKARNEMPRALYDQEFECSFLADEEFTLISAESVEALRECIRHPLEIKRVIACDPSYGGDECVIYAMENTRIIDVKVLHLKDTMLIAGEVAAMMFKHQTETSAVDCIGVGAGVYDRLREQGKRVIGINSAEKSTNGMFYNLRAEMWWYAMDLIKRGEVDYPEDHELRRELSFVKYKVINSSGLIQMEPKQDTKKMLGRSPDRADAFIYGLWALRSVSPIKKDAWSSTVRAHGVSSMAVSAMAA